MLHIGPTSEINVFRIDGNEEAARQTPMFARGRLDHFAFRAESIEQFDALRAEISVTSVPAPGTQATEIDGNGGRRSVTRRARRAVAG